MPIVSITRIKVRFWSHLPAFLVQTFRIARQAARADGSLAVALLRDRGKTFWTSTSWSSEGAMKAFMHAKPHGPTMRKLMEWSNETALVHWTQAGAELPSGRRHINVFSGTGGRQRSTTRHRPTRRTPFPTPTTGPTRELRFK